MTPLTISRRKASRLPSSATTAESSSRMSSMAENSRLSCSPERRCTTGLDTRLCQRRFISTAEVPACEPPAWRRPFERDRAHVLHALLALDACSMRKRIDWSRGASFCALESRAMPLSWKPSWAYSSATKPNSSTALSYCLSWA